MSEPWCVIITRTVGLAVEVFGPYDEDEARSVARQISVSSGEGTGVEAVKLSPWQAKRRSKKRR